jgi:tetratricopeptide (TPR) repeat protein
LRTGRRLFGHALALALLLTATACATHKPAPGPPVAWRQPDIPQNLVSHTAAGERYQHAWSLIRGGDTRGGERELNALLKSDTAFYPAAASLGELRLQRQQYREAGTLFSQALALDPKYTPALVGAIDAHLGAGDDAGALTALRALLVVDPSRQDAKTRLEAVQLRVSQSELAMAERLRAGGQFAEAEAHLLSALDATPENGAVLRSLAAVALAKGDVTGAEGRARQAVALDAQDAAAHAALGDVLEAQGRYRDAATAYARAVAIDPRQAYRDRRTSLQSRAEAEALPESYRAIETAPTVTRAAIAAMLGVRLSALLERVPARVTEVVTDVRGHWAAPWILPVVRAGWIDARPNHTFQPAAVVRRADLARIVAAVLTSAAALRGRGVDVYGAGSSPAFADVPRDHAAYRVAAIAVSAGIMTADGNRFAPAAAVTGSELVATIARLEARTK